MAAESSDAPAFPVAEARYRAIFAQVAEGIFFFDAESKRILEANPAFWQLVGYDRAEFAGLTLHDLIAHDPASIDANIRRIVAAGQHAIGERQYRRKDGSLVSVEVRAMMLAEGGRTVLCAVVRDLTRQKAAEAALRASEARARASETHLRAIVANAPSLIVALDRAGVITFAGGRGLATLGRTPEEVFGQSAFVLSRWPSLPDYLRRALSGECVAGQIVVAGRTFDARNAPLSNDDGAVIGAISVALDVTARVRAEAALRCQEIGLSATEREVLPLLARADLTTYRQIAALLHRSPDTVRDHMQAIARKLGVTAHRSAVVAAALARGLLSPPSSAN